MRKIVTFSTLSVLICLINHNANAGPWFTGPILAPNGHIVPKGHTNLEVYALEVQSDGVYNSVGKLRRSPLFSSFVLNPVITHGVTDWLDVQLTIPYAFNNTMGVNYNRIGDITTSLGIQLIEQNKSPWTPDIRLLLQETFPTGAYKQLNPYMLGTDSTGLGTYETQFGLNFQHLAQVFKTHYLRTRLILSHLCTSSVHVSGLNSYGGTPTTNGTVGAGDQSTVDLAFEYTLTQNWVAVMEGYVSHGDETRFDGAVEIGNLGGPTTTIGNGAFNQTGLAPAIEYNFNANVGLIGGVWFPVYGVNTSHFITYTLALNAYW